MKAKIFDSFGDALSHVIEKRGLKATYICEKTGIDNGQMSRYLSGAVNPQKINQNKLTDLLNVTIEQNASGEWLLKEHSRTGSVNDGGETYNSKNEKIENLEAAMRLIQITIDELKNKDHD